MKQFCICMRWIVCLIGLPLIASCTDTSLSNELRMAQADMVELKKERDMLQASVTSLYSEIERLQSQCLDKHNQLQSQNKRLREQVYAKNRKSSGCSMLEHRYKLLQKWSLALVEGYGPGIWMTDPDLQHPLYERKPRDASVEGIIEELNAWHRQTGSPTLVLKKIDNNVAYVGTSDDRKLTSQMGSAGAAAYLQSTLYSLSSLPGIDCVFFDIQEGDHAYPDKYCK